MDRLSVVIVTYQSVRVIDRCLDAVIRLLPFSQVLVVDNASSDGTWETISRRPNLYAVRQPYNTGFGRACNRGVKALDSEHVVFVNPDVCLRRVCRTQLACDVTRSPTGLLAPIITDATGSRARVFTERPWTVDLFWHTAGSLRPRELGKRGTWMHRSASRADWASGALLVARREEFLEVGGFDDRYFLYYEDRDLARRYRTHGWPIRPTRALEGEHSGGASSGPDDLRLAPLGWSLLGWIQYLVIWEGEEMARRAASSALRSLRALNRGLGLARAAGNNRVERKREQIAGVLTFLAQEGGAQDGFCPEARRIVLEVLQ